MPIETLLIPQDLKFLNRSLSTELGFASSVISILLEKSVIPEILLIIELTVSGFINEGVPPPKNIDLISSFGINLN
jgi:hypothetical protein